LVKEFRFYKKLTDKRKIFFEYRVKSYTEHYQFKGKQELFLTDEMKIIIVGTYTILTFGIEIILLTYLK